MKNRGFSLIELMVTIAVIGILASLIAINLQSAKVKGRDAKRKADVEAVASALEIYYAQNKAYPTATNMDGLKSIIYPAYISSWPVDPKTTTEAFPDGYLYYYKVNEDASRYVVDAKLEGKSDCDSDISLNSPSDEDKFYLTGIVCSSSDNKNHYRVAGR